MGYLIKQSNPTVFYNRQKQMIREVFDTEQEAKDVIQSWKDSSSLDDKGEDGGDLIVVNEG